MTLTLQEAWKGLPAVCPNPPVGCVLVDGEHRFLCATHHKVFGGPHAEALALEATASMNLNLQEGATLYVSLEPCSHEGKTPSCAQALLQRGGIKKVVYGLKDPNPLVAGKGLKALREGGVMVEPFPLTFTESLEEVAEIFLYNMRNRHCFFGAKVASSLDGHLAMKKGESQWISGTKALEYAHFLRACYDGVLVGGDTFTMDNPKLNVRWPSLPQKRNRVVVLDSEGSRIHKIKESLLYRHHDPKEIFWVVKKQLKNIPCEMLVCKTLGNGDLDLEDLRQQLWERGVRSLLIEGGAYTLSSFLKVIQRFHLILSPRLLGAKSALSWSQHLQVPSLEEALFWELSSWMFLPPDTVLSYKTKRTEKKSSAGK